ncbi:MAG TPA: hypothetical protein CFH84_10055 [Sulfurimonas sp. UBA12504]|nr:MAG TPA: hypothetical protein CFH84_10055 [Sulfurimonas sp. UBA12504]
MAIKNRTNEPLRYKRGSSALKKVWDYMRRNRTFRFGDVMMITGVTHNYLKAIIWHLSRVGYVEMVEKVKPYSATQFTLIKYTGAKSPSIINGTVFDYNLNKEIKIETTPTLTKLLTCMTGAKMSKHTIATNAGVSFAVAKRWFTKLSEMGIISEIYPIERVDGTKAFLIDLEKIEQLKIDIKSGTFKIKGALNE